MRLPSGKNREVPEGTTPVRGSVSPLFAPARNHTLPDWCALMSTGPPVLKNGTSAAGNENAHCHHLALSSPVLGPVVGNDSRIRVRCQGGSDSGEDQESG